MKDITKYSPYKQQNHTAPYPPGFYFGKALVSRTNIQDASVNQPDRSKRQYNKKKRIGPKGGGKIQFEKIQTHSGTSTAWTTQPRQYVEETGNG